MKISTYIISFLLTYGIATSTAGVEPLQIKGIQLGQDAASACTKSPITTKLDDFVRKYRDRAPNLKLTDISECTIPLDTFAERKIDSGVDLLFFRNKLIQLKFQLEPMHWMEYGEIYTLLGQMYGEPTITKSEVFTTHLWRQENKTLMLSRADTSSGIDALEIILRDGESFHTYEQLSDSNQEVIKSLADETSKRDIRN